MGISPRKQGDLLPLLVFTIQDDSGAVVNLTGLTSASFGIVIKSATARIVGSGVFALTNTGSDGKVTYTPSTADVAQSGSFQLELAATFPGGKTLTTDSIPFKILARL